MGKMTKIYELTMKMMKIYDETNDEEDKNL